MAPRKRRGEPRITEEIRAAIESAIERAAEHDVIVRADLAAFRKPGGRVGRPPAFGKTRQRNTAIAVAFIAGRLGNHRGDVDRACRQVAAQDGRPVPSVKTAYMKNRTAALAHVRPLVARLQEDEAFIEKIRALERKDAAAFAVLIEYFGDRARQIDRVDHASKIARFARAYRDGKPSELRDAEDEILAIISTENHKNAG